MAAKYCPRCSNTKDVCEFSKNKARLTKGRDGLASYCKQCVREYGKEKAYDKKRWESNKEKESERHRAYMQDNKEQLKRYKENAKRYRKENAAAVNATNRARGKWRFVPIWAEKDQMVIVYVKAKELSKLLGVPMEVDHIVPLRGKTVCGLHCLANLQVLSKELNHKKRHFTWPDMP